jgi:hypothetical protein
MLRKKLKEGQQGDNQSPQGGRDISSLPFFFVALVAVMNYLDQYG